MFNIQHSIFNDQVRTRSAFAFLCAACVFCVNGFGAERAEFGTGPLTNDVVVAVEWQEQYAWGVLTNSCGGVVEGTASGWHDAGTMMSNVAMAYRRCFFTSWQNVPAGMESSNPLVFALDGAYTNVIALFDIPTEDLYLRAGAGPQPAFEIQAWKTARMQRCTGSLTNAEWQTLATFPYGTTNWTDPTATGTWEMLYYRLAQ